MTNTAHLIQLEAAAWEALDAAHRTTVFRLAYLMLGNAADADDVAQETFIRAYRAVHTFDPERDPRPWLLGICANLCRNRRRSARRFVAMLQRLVFAEPELALSRAPDGGAAAEAALRADALWRAVRRLPAVHQEIVYLRHFLQLSEAEAGAALGVPAGTVKSRTHRALLQLRTVIVKDFPELHEADHE